MTQSKWHRFFAAILVTAMLVTLLAPAAFAAEQAAPAYQEIRASEVTGTIPGNQFAKIWLGIAPERPGTVTVTAVWDRSNPEQNGLGFFVLNEANLAAVVAGQNLRDNNVGAGSTNFFLNGPDNQQGANFRATGGAYTVIVYNDSASDANFTLSIDNGVLVDGSGQVKAVGAAEEVMTETPAEETPSADTASTTPAATVTETATPAAEATEAAVTTTVVAAGPYRGTSVKGELNEQYAQHYLGLEPDQRDGDITLRLTFDPRDNQELARRLGFWVLDDQGFRRYQAGQNAGDVAVAAGNRVSTPGEDNVRSASFNASGFGVYTVIVYNNSRVPATYELSVTGGTLLDDSQQTITAQEMVTGTTTTTTAPAATTAATTSTTTTSTGVTGQPGGTYTVQSGDTLAIIARDIYGDFRLYEQLCAINNIADCNIIEVGQVIKLPTREEIGATGTAATTTATATPAATVAATPAATTATTTTVTTAVTTTTPVTSTDTTTGTTTTRPTTGSTATGTIAQVAANNPNFSILSQALEATGLDAALASGEYTVFAPTDAAFNDLLATTGLTTDQLLKASELVQILQYHVLSGQVLAEDVTNGMKATTLQGKPVTFEVKDGSVYINGAKVTITDIPATNGVIHAISAVILPPAQ